MRLGLVESRLRTGPSWRNEVLRLVDDPDPRVRFQAAIALGGSPLKAEEGDPVPEALARVAARDGQDRWSRAAVFSSLSGREAAFVEAIRKLARRGKPLAPELLTELGRMAALAIGREQWPSLLRLVVVREPGGTFPLSDQAALLTGLAESMRGKLASARSGDLLEAMAAGDAGLATSIREVVDAMAATALDSAAGIDRRREAVGLLGFAGFEKAGETLLKLVDRASRRRFRSRPSRRSAPSATPRSCRPCCRRNDSAGRRRRSATRSSPRCSTSRHTCRRSSMPWPTAGSRRVPWTHSDVVSCLSTPTRGSGERAGALFGAISSDRAKVYESYKDVIRLTPDPAHGRAVFRRECAQCHRLDQEGTAVGPDLFGIRNQPKESILLHILVPDQEITQGFTAYSVATEDGRVLTGLIVSETPAAITLRQALGKEDTIPRDQVAELSASKQSLMPQGLEKSISRQEFADLLAYLKGEAAGSR